MSYLHKPSGNSTPDVSPKSKPIAKVCPIDNKSNRSLHKSVQTDHCAIKSGIDKIINLEDYERSLRIVGRVNSTPDSRNLNVNDTAQTQIALNEQRKINQELKKLLVASLGTDLAEMFAKLNEDVAHLNSQVEELLTERLTVRESADDRAIEADLWRHKFLAGRAVLDELDCWKQQLETRHGESVRALTSLLRERNELRRLLSQSNTVLQGILCTPSSSSTFVSDDNHHTLNLANRTLSLANSLATSISPRTNRKSSADLVTKLTIGEEAAIDAIKNQNTVQLTSFPTRQAVSSLRSARGKSMEKMSLHICGKCKGEVFVV